MTTEVTTKASFIVSSTVLGKALAPVDGVIAASPIVPITECFLFRVEGNKLTVTGSDLQSTVIVEVPIESAVEEPQLICLPAKLLMDTLRGLPEQPLSIVINSEDHHVDILTDNGAYHLAGQEAVNFPKVPEVQVATVLEIGSDALSAGIAHTAFATATDELRPAMTGVSVNVGESRTTFAASDGHRLAVYRRTDITSHTGSEVVIPRKVLTLLASSLPADVMVTVEISQTNARFRFGQTQLICRLITEPFAQFEAILSPSSPHLVGIGRGELLASLKRVLVYTNRTTHQVRLTISTNQLTIAAEDLDYNNQAHEKLLCVYEGEGLEIGFNGKFLADVLSHLSAKMIELQLTAPHRACLIVPQDKAPEEEITMLLMPVLLNQYQP